MDRVSIAEVDGWSRMGEQAEGVNYGDIVWVMRCELSWQHDAGVKR